MNLLHKVFVGGIGSDLTVMVMIWENKAPTFLFKFLHELNEPLIFKPVRWTEEISQTEITDWNPTTANGKISIAQFVISCGFIVMTCCRCAVPTVNKGMFHKNVILLFHS